MKDWKTTLFGALFGISTSIATTPPTPQIGKWASLAAGLFGAVFGWFCKDKPSQPTA